MNVSMFGLLGFISNHVPLISICVFVNISMWFFELQKNQRRPKWEIYLQSSVDLFYIHTRPVHKNVDNLRSAWLCTHDRNKHYIPLSIVDFISFEKLLFGTFERVFVILYAYRLDANNFFENLHSIWKIIVFFYFSAHTFATENLYLFL